jgi:hypothetical protein
MQLAHSPCVSSGARARWQLTQVAVFMGGKVRQFVAARKLRDSATKPGLNQQAGKQAGGGLGEAG